MAERMRLLRRRSGRTQQQIADYIGVSLKAYQNYEYGTRQPNMADVPSIARAMGIDPCDFFREPPGSFADEAPLFPRATRMTREWMDFLDEELAGVSDEEEREEIEALTELLARKVDRARRRQP